MAILAPRQRHQILVAVDEHTVAGVGVALTHGSALPLAILRLTEAPDSPRVVVCEKVAPLQIGELAAAVDVAPNNGAAFDVRVGVQRRLGASSLNAELLVVAQLPFPSAPAIIFPGLDDVDLFTAGLSAKGDRKG